MADYTLTTDDAQEAVLSWIVKNYNLEHDLKLTNTDYVNLRLPQMLAPYVPAYQDAVGAAIKGGFKVASPAVQAQVLALLGATP